MALTKAQKAIAAAVAALTKDQIGLVLQIAQASDNKSALAISDADNAPLIAAGLVATDEVNFSRDDQGRAATVITDAGRAFLAGANVGYAAPAGTDASAPASTDTATDEKPVFAFAEVEVPTVQRRGGSGGSKAIYPFDQLGLNKGEPNSFFVPKSDKTPEPWKTLASTVTAANKRHSETVNGPDGKPLTETYTIRAKKAKGTPGQPGYEAAVASSTGSREKTNPLRKFVLRHVKDGAQWGEAYKGVEGAAVIRVPLDSPAAETAAGAAPAAPAGAPAPAPTSASA